MLSQTQTGRRVDPGSAIRVRLDPSDRESDESDEARCGALVSGSGAFIGLKNPDPKPVLLDFGDILNLIHYG